MFSRLSVVWVSNHLFCVLQEILLQDVQEFVPYVFQILSLMLELRGGEGNVPESYMALFPHLLVPVLWERPANIHPLVRLLQAYIQAGKQQVRPGSCIARAMFCCAKIRFVAFSGGL